MGYIHQTESAISSGFRGDSQRHTKKRIVYLDVAKGISIFLVALGHSHLLGKIESDKLNAALALSRMPLFFFVSGIFFTYHKPCLRYLAYKFDALIKPFLVTVSGFLILIFLACNWFDYGEAPAPGNIVGSFYGNGDSLYEQLIPIWFLPHLWVVFGFSYLVLKTTAYERQSATFQASILGLLMLLGNQFIRYYENLIVVIPGIEGKFPGLPFSLDLVPLTSFYFILGFTLRKWAKQFKPNYIIFAVGISWILISAYFFGAQIDFNRRMFQKPLFALSSSLAGIYCILTFSAVFSRYEWSRKVLSYLGRYSLFILIFQLLIYSQMIDKIFLDHITIWTSLGALTSSILISVALGYMISKSNLLSLFFRPLKTNRFFITKN